MINWLITFQKCDYTDVKKNQLTALTDTFKQSSRFRI